MCRALGTNRSAIRQAQTANRAKTCPRPRISDYASGLPSQVGINQADFKGITVCSLLGAADFSSCLGAIPHPVADIHQRCAPRNTCVRKALLLQTVDRHRTLETLTTDLHLQTLDRTGQAVRAFHCDTHLIAMLQVQRPDLLAHL